MRVSAQTKAATREKILRAAKRLLAQDGYESTTTRDIAEAAQIASGTLFNYFPTKQAIVSCLASEAVAEALSDASPGESGAETLEEGLFAVVAAVLRKLEAATALAAKYGYGELSPSALQLYWTLYTGVLVFWANDKSPKQEESLALIDDSINMFVGWLRSDTTGRKH